MSFLGLLGAKNEEKLKKICLFFDQVNNQFAHFGGLKNLKVF